MLFNTIPFLVFLPLVFVLFWTIQTKHPNFGKLILLISSYIFYGWWDWRFLILIFISSAADFIIGRLLYSQNKHSHKKLLLGLSTIINIGILFFFKYYNFFIESFQSLFKLSNNGNWTTLNIILPVGISFYTFQTLSYTIDIYRNKIEPTKSALTFFTFVSFFPQLVAGPIERASRLIPQFDRKQIFSFSQASDGLKLILWGLFKKMVIADQLAIIVNTVYGQPENFSGIGIIASTFLFGFQIYCDFSGYSDIAIGTAKLFGIELMSNFKTPYLATSFSDFWHRWHISLSTWFRDYLYISLGGNRKGRFSWSRNILITFLISGLWHGANVTFLLWGLFHGIFYIFEKFLSPFINIGKRLKTTFGWLITFTVVNCSWILFRAESAQHLKLLWHSIQTNLVGETWSIAYSVNEYPIFTEPFRVLFFIFPLFLIAEKILKMQSFPHFIKTKHKAIRWSCYYILILSILFFGVLKSAPQFIYFQF
jgi:D-alanyl-lipoteichoic acid acyltransferase DltB (MBOAT superfamily)